jgi:enoyl-CoA hydratase
MNNLLLEVENGIAVVTINRPKSLNALNSETLAELNACFSDIEKRDDVKVLILTGSGEKSFVAGADISEMVNNDAIGGRKMALLAKAAFEKLENMRQATIAAVNGFALGGGCEIAMACDIRVASENAKFAQPEVGLGTIPGFGGTQRLPRLVGIGVARELIYTGRNVKADEAKAIGLVNRVVPAESLLDETLAMIRTIAAKSGIAVRYAKIALNRGADTDIYKALELEKDLIALCFATEDQKEGCRAFLEKRPARFTS